jgi:hypothetical protein
VSDTLKVMTEEIVGAEFSSAGTSTSATSKVLYEFSLQCCSHGAMLSGLIVGPSLRVYIENLKTIFWGSFRML